MAITDQLISYWKLEEASGVRADSVLASGNDLTDVNTVTQAVGKIGNAGQFTAANFESLTRVSNASLQTGDIDFTVAAWIYLDTNLGQLCYMAKYDAGAANEEYYLQTTTLRFDVNLIEGVGGAIKTAVVNVVPATATWYYVIAWYDSTANSLNISVNDGAIGTGTLAAVLPPAATTGTFRVGALQAATRNWNGRIDEVGFWKRVLTAPERTSLYNAGAGLTYPFGEGGAPKTGFRNAIRIGL